VIGSAASERGTMTLGKVGDPALQRCLMSAA
jgi:hypothetical protein